jgi:hypothetical protein
MIGTVCPEGEPEPPKSRPGALAWERRRHQRPPPALPPPRAPLPLPSTAHLRTRDSRWSRRHTHRTSSPRAAIRCCQFSLGGPER